MVSDASIFTLTHQRGDPTQNPLIAFLSKVQDRNVEIQCDDMIRMDAQNLQIILCAQRKWQDKGLAFEMTRMSEAFRDSLSMMGLEYSQFDNGDPS